MVEFEESLHERFSVSGRALERVYSGGLPKNPTLLNNEKSLRVLGYDNYEFVYGRLRDVRRENIGDLQQFNHVSQENWNRLTTSFLLRRLFGLTQQR